MSYHGLVKRLDLPAGWPERQALAYRRLALDGRLRSGQ